jgi:hypothetical protein
MIKVSEMEGLTNGSNAPSLSIHDALTVKPVKDSAERGGNMRLTYSVLSHPDNG